MRILRVIRGVKSARAMANFVLRRRAEGALLASLLLALLLVVCCSIAVLEFEVPAGGNIASAEDAVWWAVSTMTTVGYGDRYLAPTGDGGRFLCIGWAGRAQQGTASEPTDDSDGGQGRRLSGDRFVT
jgi:voltage-gated potassium channel